MIKTLLKYVFATLIISTSFYCSSVKKEQTTNTPIASSTDTIKIVNEKEKYEIIIIDPGFNTWLIANAEQRGYFSQQFLEIRNQNFVNSWNLRVNLPQQFNPDLYCLKIDFNPLIDYGYEVNYLLYNYFLYFQKRYNQKLV
ncbi:DUF6146 family protein [Wenyingzhuangia sp. IMCC45574]